ncbi:MAG: metallopeptidase family protein [Alphaproteobacteria bacterium]
MARPQHPPSLDDLAAIAEETMARLPAMFRVAVKSVPILVEEFPSEEVEADMGLETPFDILGLYQGVDLASKSLLDAPGDIDRIFLYRRPILDYWCETEEALDHVVAHVLIHEIGHHLGLSDDDMEAIEADAR